MSNCITINGIEHLHNEDTLLINYTLLCSGTWYLSQYLTAYRNVCDTGWTIMFPNHQHPRHTDFPITVGDNPTMGTFAWNYGGIQGISAENFDNEHSYLLQLTVFEYGCSNSGTSGSNPTTGYHPTTGATTGLSTGNPGHPGGGGGGSGGGGGGGPNPGYPGIPKIPIPQPGGEIPTLGKMPGGRPSGGGSSQSEPDISIPSIPGFPTEPTWHKLYSGSYLPTSGTNPQGGIIPDINGIGSISPTEPSLPTFEVSSAYPTEQPQEPIRPSAVPPGGGSNPNLEFKSVSRNPSIPSQPGIIPIMQRVPEIDPNTTTTSQLASIAGQLSSTLAGGSFPTQASPKQIKLLNNNYNDYIDIQVASTEVEVGDPLVFSCLFTPPNGVQFEAKLSVSVLFQEQELPIVSTQLTLVNYLQSLTCGQSVHTHQFSPGAVTLLAKVTDSNNQVVAVKAILCIILERNNTGEYSSTKVTIGQELPPVIINNNDNKINTGYIQIDLPANTTKFLILEADEPQSSISIVLRTKYGSQDSYSMSLYDRTISDVTITTSDVTEVIRVTNEEIAYIKDKFKIEDKEVYPHTHTVGIRNQALPNTNYLTIEISPEINNEYGNTIGYLHLSENFHLRTMEATITASGITVSTPYMGEQLALIVNGSNSGNIPIGYSLIQATSDLSGHVAWSGLSLAVGDYFSIITKTNGVFNPFVPPIYTSQYTL